MSDGGIIGRMWAIGCGHEIGEQSNADGSWTEYHSQNPEVTRHFPAGDWQAIFNWHVEACLHLLANGQVDDGDDSEYVSCDDLIALVIEEANRLRPVIA